MMLSDDQNAVFAVSTVSGKIFPEKGPDDLAMIKKRKERILPA